MNRAASIVGLAAVSAAVLASTLLPAAAASPPAAARPAAAPLAAPVAPRTVLSGTPKVFSTTDGDLLAVARINGLSRPAIGIGGNFSHVITSDGVSHAAKNFAVLDARTGAVIYAGNVNSYVRAIASYKGITYIGGDFGSVSGVARRRAAALDSRFRLMAWNPSPAHTVRALATDSTGVYITGDFGSLRKIPLVRGRTLWSKPISGGSGRALQLLWGNLYLGGLFDAYAGYARHGLIKINPKTGVMYRSFNARLRSNSHVGPAGAFDGEGVLSLGAVGRSVLIVGVGGEAPVGKVSNQLIRASASTGAGYWRQVLVGDCQAVAVVGATDIAGYHRNTANGPTPFPFFGAQVNDADGALTTWDPRLTGSVGNNDDHGNGGIQGMFADASLKTLYVAGAFTQWNGTAKQSLVAYAWS
jgi:hypothetical protein